MSSRPASPAWRWLDADAGAGAGAGAAVDEKSRVSASRYASVHMAGELPGGSAELLDTDQVARGIAEGTVAHAVWLLGRLLDDFGAAGLL